MSKNASKIGVLVVNLGTPDSPTPPAVKRYLSQFLHDQRVIDYTRWFWCPLLHFVILPFRSKRSAKAYQTIWTEQGSPLLLHSQSVADKLQQSMGDEVVVELAMTYGSPNMDSALANLANANVDKVVVLPLYPQYSSTTTAAVFDAVAKSLKKVRTIPELRFINSYCLDDNYQQALVDSVETFWQQQGGKSEKLLMSFHGIPERYVRDGDIYQAECEACAKELANRLGLKDDQWMVTYQSRVGKETWLNPYTDKTLEALPEQGTKSVDVICPAFAVDCLETLEEIAMENREIFEEAGGQQYRYIPALNDNEQHIAALKQLITKHTKGWT